MRNKFNKVIQSQYFQCIVFLGTLCIIFLSLEADARVGGGDSYGGGRRSGGSSWSTGSGRNGYYGNDGFIFDLIFWIFRLCFRYPAFGIPFLLLVIFIIYRGHRKAHSYDNYYSSYESHAPSKQINRTRDFVSTMTKIDPLFSFPLFKDFIFSLYLQFHELRGQKKLDLLSQYFSEDMILKNNRNESLINVDGVVLGNCQIQDVRTGESVSRIKIFFTANYTEYYKDGKSQRYLLKETWVLQRGARVKSKPPEAVEALACPNCGAPITETVSGKCYRCGESNKNGKFAWYVVEMSAIREPFTPANANQNLFTPTIIEEGTKLPTIKDPNIDLHLASTFKDRSELEYTRNRIQDIFLNLQKAWSEQKWEMARPFESDALFQSHYYWIEDFKRKQEKNIIDNVQIEKIVPVALYSDKYYMSITVRIFASMIDYTKNQSGKIIRGSAHKKIHFTEYWSFIKGVGENHKNAKIRNLMNCPSCGAELKISMSGKCEYCESRITLGQFDWVLSQIEQDEEFSL